MATDRELRVLVALDNAEPNERALRLLAVLDPRAALEITGLFVEDEDLLAAARLPGLQEISLTGQQLRLDPERLARDLAQAAARARRAFDTLASRLGGTGVALSRHSEFVVTRGRVTEEYYRAAEHCDAVIVTRGVHTSGLRSRPGRSFLTLARQPKPVLFVNEPWESGSSVVVLAGDAGAVDTAARLARAEGLRLIVAAPPGANAASQELPKEAAPRQLADWEEDTIARLCVAVDARLLVLPARSDVDLAELLVSLMDRLPCSLLKLS
ncbi:MAG: hypothetical protein RIC56_20535 [Pseudomonadales bacterium]